MAITSISTTYTTSGPAFTNQVMALGGRDATEIAYHGVFNFTGDGAATSATFNWIDGVQTPFFTQANPPVAVAPKAVFLGGTNSAAAGTAAATNVSSVTSTGCVITFSAAPSAVAYTLPFIIYPYAT
jgi:hypothetical protein